MTTQSITSGQRKQYLRFVEDAADNALSEVGLDKDGIQKLIENGGELQKRVIALIKELSVGSRFSDRPLVLALLKSWEKYFYEIHQLKVDFAGVRIPEADDDVFPWFVCVPENFSNERAYRGGKKLYSRKKWTDEALGEVLDLSFGRDAQKGPYIVRFRANWKSDENLKNLSAVEIAKRKIDTATLKERLFLGDFLYWKHKGHLDFNNWTLCSGSRYLDGGVPSVLWDSIYRELQVAGYASDDVAPNLCAREVVSC